MKVLYCTLQNRSRQKWTGPNDLDDNNNLSLLYLTVRHHRKLLKFDLFQMIPILEWVHKTCMIYRKLLTNERPTITSIILEITIWIGMFWIVGGILLLKNILAGLDDGQKIEWFWKIYLQKLSMSLLVFFKLFIDVCLFVLFKDRPIAAEKISILLNNDIGIKNSIVAVVCYR